MKKLILVAVMALLTITTFAQNKGVKFSEGTLTQLQAEAAKANKLLFVDVYATWCGPCKFLSSDIFPDAEVGKYINSTFVAAKFDGEKGEGVDIMKKYGVKAYPTLLILDKDGKEVTRIVGGAATPEAFIKKVKDTLAVAKK